MPQMLTLSNGRPETILSPKDFEDLIDKHMGMDCANYYQNQIKQLSELIRDLDSYVDDNDRAMLLYIYREGDTVPDNIYQLAKSKGISQDSIWKLVNELERKVAKRRGLL